MAEYPKRPPFFAQKCIRAMAKSCAAQTMGQAAALLVAFIATQEDAKRYRGPVTFYNEQLMALLGIRKWDTFDAARKSAVLHSYLHYEAPPVGSRGKPGQYWAKIPAELEDLPDTPIDEGDPIAAAYHRGYRDGKANRPPEPYPQNGYGTTEAYPINGDSDGDSDGDSRGYGRGDSRGELTNLSLSPSPTPNPPPPPIESSSAWAAAAAAVGECKVAHAAEAVRQARSNGLSIEEVNAIIAHFKSKPGAWRGGALKTKLAKAMPGDPVSDGWPEPGKAYRLLARSSSRVGPGQRYQESDEEREQREAREFADAEAKREMLAMDSEEFHRFAKSVLQGTQLWRHYRPSDKPEWVLMGIVADRLIEEFKRASPNDIAYRSQDHAAVG